MRSGNKAVRLSDKLRGKIRIQIRAAWPEALLNACARRDIPIKNVERADACTLSMEIYEKDWETVRRLADSLQAKCTELARSGGSRDRKWMLRRAVLLCSLFFVGVLLLWSELHIWEIEVRGCEKLTRGEVLRALEDCGVSTGSFWPALSDDSVRGRMLLRLPELAWMTVNVSGSRAVVHVVERREKPRIYTESAAADVLAAKTGILRELTVLNGHPLVRTDSAVLEGEILVTGSMDSLSHPARTVRAEAIALADTWYQWNAVEPEGESKPDDDKRIQGVLALKFGRKRINLFSGSRKELDGYDKIVHEYTVGVKGLFALPLSLIREEYYRGAESGAGELAAGKRLQSMLAAQIDGEILQARVSAYRRDGCVYTTLRAHCFENIAQTTERDPP